MSEPNHFEDSTIAKEWIASIEAEKDGSRDKEIYPMLSAWIGEVSPSVVVEIGSGQGICSSKINLGSRRYIGIEPSLLLLERAKELYTAPNKKFLEGSAYSLPLDSFGIDAVFSVGVWFHIKDLDKAHQEVARILRDGGELMVVTSNPNTDYLWESFFDEHVRDGKVIEGKVRTPAGALSKNLFFIHSEKEIADSLEKKGFTIISISKFGFGREGREAYQDEGLWMAIRAVKKLKIR
ncbi:MAG TPA: class I SAM-dependent methyltransferase [Candidatus Paceibacterota bacterium]|nr:class I SAM-dependent methyltransferase [Candidatus Paceibacterota bacterium]